MRPDMATIDEMAAYSEAADLKRSVAQERERRVRTTLAPRPDVHYPTPWSVGEKLGNGHVIIVCAEGWYTCEAATPEAAEAIVTAVNAYAGVDRDA